MTTNAGYPNNYGRHEVAMFVRMFPRLAVTLWVTALAAAQPARAALTVRDEQQFRSPPVLLVPADNASTPARVALGRALFFDPRLSGSGSISCATCHNPGLGWSDGLPTAIGHGGTVLRRASPTIINAAYGKIFMWDGRKESLETQALGPLQSAEEMNMDVGATLARLTAIPTYTGLFARAYPDSPLSAGIIAKAIASFERTVISTNAPFDRWQAGDAAAVSAPAKRGFALFVGKAGCSQCHQGFNFTDDGFHNIGVKTRPGMSADEGRYQLVKVRSMRGAFKTPTLREVALTAPYMHNGIYQTLAQVIEHYDRGGDDKGNLDPGIFALHLAARDKTDLLAFMQTLTSAPLEVAVPQLPQ